MFKYIILFLIIISCDKSDIEEINFIHISGVLDNEDEILLFKGINEVRTKSLLLDANFNIAALRRIEYIKEELKEGFLMSHSGYIEAYVFLDSLGIKAIGENLAYRYINSESVVNAWLDSESHSRNLSDRKWKYMGVAIGKDEEDNKIYCAIFGY